MENICVLLVSKILFIMHEPAGGQAIHVVQDYSFSFIVYHFLFHRIRIDVRINKSNGQEFV